MTWKHIEWTGGAVGSLLLLGVVMASSLAAEPAGQPVVTTTATAAVKPEPGLEKLAQTPRIRLICGLAPEKGYLPRLQAIHALGTNLTDQETVALLAFLDQKKPDTATLEVLDFDALKNFADRPEFDRAEIGNAAMTLLRAPDTLPYIKATALQVAAILGQPEAPVVARQWLAAPGTEITLRISAIATLGQRGVPGDLAILKPLTRSGDVRIVTAARAAVAKLDPVKPAKAK